MPCRRADTGIVMIAAINKCSFGALERVIAECTRAPNSSRNGQECFPKGRGDI